MTEFRSRIAGAALAGVAASMGLAASGGVFSAAAAPAAHAWVRSQADYDRCLAQGGKVTHDGGRGQSPQLYCAPPDAGAKSAGCDYKNGRCDSASGAAAAQ